MTSAQVVETSVTNNSSVQNYSHPDDHTIRTTDTLIEQQKVAKNTTNMARMRKQKRDANKRNQELNREVKRRCRRDRRVYVESEAKRAEEAGKRGELQ